MPDALKKADEILMHVLKEIVNIIRADSSVKAKFEDIQMVLENKGVGYIGSGVGKGTNNVQEAVAMAIKNPFLDVTIDNAKFAIIMVTGDVSVIRAYDAVSYLQEYLGNEVKLFINVVRTKDNSDVCNITIIATGIEETVKQRSEFDFMSRIGLKSGYIAPIETGIRSSVKEETLRIPSFLRRI